MGQEQRYAALERQLSRAVHIELGKLDGACSRLRTAGWSVVEPLAVTDRLRRLAIVAADAGNVSLRMNPLRIAFIRVASSDRPEPLAELIFQPEIEPAELAAMLQTEVPALLAPLHEAGIDCRALLTSAASRRNALSAIREVLEWGAVLDSVGTRRPEGPVLVVRDGLLRSIHLDEITFGHLAAGLERAVAQTGNLLVAVAKSIPGGADLSNALLMGGVLDRAPKTALAFLEIPAEIESDVLPPAFVTGRRMGPLILARVRATGAFVPIELATKRPGDVERVVASLFGPDVEYWPEPGNPIEVSIAHERARISALDREWLHRAFLDGVARHNPRLASLSGVAELLGRGGPLLMEDEGA